MPLGRNNGMITGGLDAKCEQVKPRPRSGNGSVERAQSYAYMGKFHDVILLTQKPIHGRRFRNEVREQRSDGPHGRELLIGDFL
jgi:hypothetical protein